MILAFLFSFYIHIHAEVMIPTESANLFDFKNQIFKSKYQSYTQWYLKNRTSLDEEMLIIKLFNEAQKSYLNGDQDSAKNNYLKIINMEHDKDWKQPQRQLIIDSYSQMIKMSKYNKNMYITRLNAYAFIKQSFNDLSLKQFSTKYLKNWQSILINGIHYNINDIERLKFTNSLYRWTLLSDKAPAHTVIARPQDFFNKIYPQSYFYSDNENCRFNNSKDLTIKHMIFQNKDCKITPEPKLSKINTEKPSRILKTPFIKHTQPQQQKKWYHSKWFWIGTAALTGLAVYKSQQTHENKSIRPSHTEGF